MTTQLGAIGVALLTVFGAVVVKLLDRSTAAATLKATESSTVVTSALEVATGMKSLADARTAEIEHQGERIKDLEHRLQEEHIIVIALSRRIARLTGKDPNELVE